MVKGDEHWGPGWSLKVGSGRGQRSKSGQGGLKGSQSPTVRDREWAESGSSLHAQSVLAHGFPPALVASCSILVQRETLGEPEGAVLTLAAGHHDAQDEDDQQEDGARSQQGQ